MGVCMSRRLLLVAVLLAACAVGGLAWWRSTRPPPPTVVLISLDTLRPERLGVYGNDRDVSPHVDRLAVDGVVFGQALANSPYTLPSHMSMLTGLDPVAHGVKRHGDVLSSRVTTLAESLRRAGFQCGAFTDGGYVSASYGFSQGFHVFDDRRDTRKEGAVNGMRRILPRALTWLNAQDDEPLFLFLHSFDAHAPFQEGDEEVRDAFRAREALDGPQDHELFRLNWLYQMKALRIPEYGRMSELLNDYDAGVHDADAGVGGVLDWLERTGRLEGALIIVTSDHGESFADHGIHVGHGIGLTDDEIRIPLVVKLPGDEGAGLRVSVPVDLTDLAPTVLEALQLPMPPEVQGESLLGLVRGLPRQRDFIFGTSPNTESYFLVRDEFKFISSPAIPPDEVARRHLGPLTPPDGSATWECGTEYAIGHGDDAVPLCYDFEGDPLGIRDTILTGPRLFSRRADPRETANLAASDPERERLMSQFLLQVFERSLALHDELDDGTVAVPQGEVHVKQALKQLGYIGANDAQAAAQLLADMPLLQRMALLQPHVPPDQGALAEADRVLHFVRIALRDGRPTRQGAGQLLQTLGDTLVTWALDNPAHLAKVGWRLHELVMVAGQAGATVDSGRWKATFDRWRKAAQQRRAPPPADPAAP
ncbi:MAG: sulfatase, partial [Planctomycetes bacterium]|nr:sulfatase [Planctomycetota bacterium]